MAKVAKSSSSSTPRSMRPALTPEARENQLIAAANDLAEKQILDGSASPSVIIHYLKMGSSKERLELEKLKEENKLLRAKTEALQSAKNIEKLYSEAIKAMRTYSGHGPAEEEVEEDADLY